MRHIRLLAISIFAFTACAVASPASALTWAECGVRYQAAKEAGTLNGLNWTSFRSTECGITAANSEPATPQGKQFQSAAAEPDAKDAASPQRLSLKECGVKYRAAKADGSLGERKWNEFRVDACGWQARTATVAAASENGKDDAVEKTPAAIMVDVPASVTFPTAVSQTYSSETPARQRMRTCLENYHANKTAGTLSGLRWIQQGGGYYSLCNKRLKGASS